MTDKTLNQRIAEVKAAIAAIVAAGDLEDEAFSNRLGAAELRKRFKLAQALEHSFVDQVPNIEAVLAELERLRER